MDPNKIRSAKRVLTYTGPQKWLEMCASRSFVRMERELGRDGSKSIASYWKDDRLQQLAVFTPEKCERLPVSAKHIAQHLRYNFGLTGPKASQIAATIYRNMPEVFREP